jgi:hypothetical protein
VAYRIWGEVLARKKAPTRGLDSSLAIIIEDFPDYTHKHREYETYDDYRRTVQTFADKWLDVTVAELTVRHVEAWFDDHPNWSDTTRWRYSTILRGWGVAVHPVVPSVHDLAERD